MQERFKKLEFILIAGFVFLIGGLSWVQLFRTSSYHRLAEQNRIRLVPISAPRGSILDLNNVVIAEDRVSFDCWLIPREVKQSKKTLELLSDLLEEDIADSQLKASSPGWAPVLAARNLTKRQAFQIEEQSMDLSGVMIQTTPIREYQYANAGSHAIGHLGLIRQEELERLRPYGFKLKDWIGRSGVEKYYDDYLRGQDGGMQVEVDNLGREIRVLGIRAPQRGQDLYLTLDWRLQQFIDKLMENFHGAVIAMEPSSGRILAAVSKPDFDPNIFVKPKNTKAINELLRRRDFPLLDRGINCGYTPGSLFKVCVASAALEGGVITDKTQLECKGSLRSGGRSFRCWKESGHGWQEIRGAIKNSCNVFFFQMGQKAGVDRISEMAQRFGFGVPTGIDLPGESAGLLPSRFWKRLKYREGWYGGDTLNLSIGQGYILVTPVQILKMIACVANGGKLVTPYLVRRIGDVDVAPSRFKDIKISKETLSIIREGLRRVVGDDDGTGRYARVKGLTVAGKTGTAEIAGKTPHGWFSGFAGFSEPKLCLVVFLEHSGKGGLGPSKMAARIFAKAKELEIL